MDLAGIGRTSRNRLSKILRMISGPVSVQKASEILELPQSETAQLLARWAKQGWVSRVRRGLYVPIPLEAKNKQTIIDEPWLLAAKVFEPCYISGWTAAEHWDLTEQIFRTIVVMTNAAFKESEPEIGGISFLIVRVKKSRFFGLKPTWKDSVKVQVTDPSRMIVDILDTPSIGGGLVQANEIFHNYMKSDHADIQLLLKYTKHLGNGAVFKRLGFLLEFYYPDFQDAIKLCQENLTQGNAKLDPNTPCERLVTRWRLWIPAGIEKRGLRL